MSLSIFYRALMTSDADTLAWVSVEQEITTDLSGEYGVDVCAWDGMIGVVPIQIGGGGGPG